jgi:hypothetical protein
VTDAGRVAPIGSRYTRCTPSTAAQRPSLRQRRLDDEDGASVPREAHIDRLHTELRWLPCSRHCANWLAYGIQPKDTTDGMAPGACSAKAHDREHLGCGGRRVLVSRKWTGKTLTEHKADLGNAVRTVLQAAGMAIDDADRFAASSVREDGTPRYVWQSVKTEDLPSYTGIIARSIAERNQWRAEYEQAGCGSFAVHGGKGVQALAGRADVGSEGGRDPSEKPLSSTRRGCGDP